MGGRTLQESDHVGKCGTDVLKPAGYIIAQAAFPVELEPGAIGT